MNTNELSPKGFREYDPLTQDLFNQIIDKIAKVYTSFGYQNIFTTSIEYLDVISGNDDTSKEIFSVGRSSGDDQGRQRALRFDLTKPMARYVVQNFNDLAFPFKRYQIQQSWRGERAQKGRYREFFQADVDVVGIDSLPIFYDGEVLEVATRALDVIDIGGFTVKINNRKLIQGVFESLGVTESEIPEYLRILDKVDKIGIAEVKNEYLKLGKIDTQKVDWLFTNVLNQKVDLYEINKFVENIDQSNELISQGVQELVSVAENLKNIDLNTGKIILDTGIIRGLDYYTGFVFETTIDDWESFGSILSGGRYDNLIEGISNKKLPGVGSSIGVSRLFAIIEEIGVEKFQEINNSVLIANMDGNNIFELKKVSDKLRLATICEVYATNSKLVKQIKYGEKKGYKYLLILEQSGEFTLKDLTKRSQENYNSVEEILNVLITNQISDIK